MRGAGGLGGGRGRRGPCMYVGEKRTVLLGRHGNALPGFL